MEIFVILSQQQFVAASYAQSAPVHEASTLLSPKPSPKSGPIALADRKEQCASQDFWGGEGEGREKWNFS